MSDEKIEAVVSKLEEDVAGVSEELGALLTHASIDSISALKPEDEKATPYAITAYALSSLLFAYLRSEGQDVAVVIPELTRVREKMEKLNKLATDRRSEKKKPEKKSAKRLDTSAAKKSEKKPAKKKAKTK